MVARATLSRSRLLGGLTSSDRCAVRSFALVKGELQNWKLILANLDGRRIRLHRPDALPL